MKKFYIDTFGCQMNVYDGIRIADMLKKLAFVQVQDEKEADVILLNTCHIREKAAEKVFSRLGRIKKALEKSGKQVGGEGSQVVIGVIGCVAKAMGKEIFKRTPYVSIVLSSQRYHLLPDMIDKSFVDLMEEGKARNINVDVEDGIEKFDELPQLSKSSKVAFLAIQEGCDKFCTYCVVPYTRGREISRPVEAVLKEAKNLNDLGAVEINLLGQNVDAYHGVDVSGEEKNLAYIIKEVAKLENVKRIRYTTSYPTQLGDELMELHGSEPKLMPLIYLPMQAGSDNVLKTMNRRYTQESYLATIDRLKEINPNVQISSDFIVGYVDETDEDFEETLKVVERVGFIQAFSFKYSRRPGTAGDRMEGGRHVAEDIKAERLERLQALLKKKQSEFYDSCVGKIMKVLFEYKGEKTGLWVGRTEYMQPVMVKSDNDLEGEILEVEIESAGHSVLHGKI
ncbi:MAG: tRNA (N6-isopentenyl adenosine(37)-C2)-methylthiotransferase MiaB [Alphaproteobacteria bacterium]|nr:tRNA (N6-isopentenyl adenosine(37)-C2)-methylthiotransferase MiaB [Alphaproteobacteria bacterium]